MTVALQVLMGTAHQFLFISILYLKSNKPKLQSFNKTTELGLSINISLITLSHCAISQQ